jgi:hypothetical protein
MLINQELIDYLEQQFPNKSPELNDSERLIWIKAGQSSVVAHLKKLKDDQNDNLLKIQTLGNE